MRTIPDRFVHVFHERLMASGGRRKMALALELVERELSHLLAHFSNPRSAAQTVLIRHRELYEGSHPELFKLRGPRGPYHSGRQQEKGAEPAPANPLQGWSTEEIHAAADREIITEAVRAQKQRQRLLDTNRIERKAFRHHARIENAVEELTRELVAQLREATPQLDPARFASGPLDPEAPVGVVHLSDIHANELIDLPDNRYDFQVMARRLQLLARKVKALGGALGVRKLVVLFGGDLINSDRRMDELLSAACNRASAIQLAAHLFTQLLLDLAGDFQVETFAVTGNEGRAGKELGWSGAFVTDNHDATIYNIVRTTLRFAGAPVKTHPLRGNEQIVQVHGQSILLIHGHQIRAQDQKSVQALIGRHIAEGRRVTHVVAGHIHSTLISDFVSRNSSLCGSNAYSAEGLGFASKAAQNFHLVTRQGMDSVKLDLQDASGVEGYAVVEELEAYQARSVDQLHRLANPPQPIVVVA